MFPLLFITILLVVDPVSAKGGGSGGGGGGGGGRRRRYPPPVHRANATLSDILPWNPFTYRNMPEMNEKLQVLVNLSTRTYMIGKVVSIDERQGTFEVLREDDVRIKMHCRHNSGFWIFVACLLVFFRITSAQNRKLLLKEKDFDKMLDKQKLPDQSTTPASGTFVGFTDESYGSFQKVEVRLSFEPNGVVRGDGVDDKDGEYTVKGNWAGDHVRWEETYSRKFTATVRGTFITGKNGLVRFKGMFRSSRGISGDVLLRVQRPSEKGESIGRRRRTLNPMEITNEEGSMVSLNRSG